MHRFSVSSSLEAWDLGIGTFIQPALFLIHMCPFFFLFSSFVSPFLVSPGINETRLDWTFSFPLFGSLGTLDGTGSHRFVLPDASRYWC